MSDGGVVLLALAVVAALIGGRVLFEAGKEKSVGLLLIAALFIAGGYALATAGWSA
jgi:hypothetical protein